MKIRVGEVGAVGVVKLGPGQVAAALLDGVANVRAFGVRGCVRQFLGSQCGSRLFWPNSAGFERVEVEAAFLADADVDIERGADGVIELAAVDSTAVVESRQYLTVIPAPEFWPLFSGSAAVVESLSGFSRCRVRLTTSASRVQLATYSAPTQMIGAKSWTESAPGAGLVIDTEVTEDFAVSFMGYPSPNSSALSVFLTKYR